MLNLFESTLTKLGSDALHHTLSNLAPKVDARGNILKPAHPQYHETGRKLHARARDEALAKSHETKDISDQRKYRQLAAFHNKLHIAHSISPTDFDSNTESIVGVPMGFKERVEIKLILETYSYLLR